MGGINVGAVMDSLATAFASVTGVTKALGYPTEDYQSGYALVGYPESIEFDLTFAIDEDTRSKDRAVFPVLVICGLVQDKSARDVLSAVLLGSGSVTAAVEGSLSGTVDFCRVGNPTLERVVSKDIQYLALRFDCEVVA